MPLNVRSVVNPTGSPDREGVIVYDADRLVAILVNLSVMHDDRAGMWHLEYGPNLKVQRSLFGTIEAALEWMESAREVEVDDQDA